jgi:hypothetical protein
MDYDNFPKFGAHKYDLLFHSPLQNTSRNVKNNIRKTVRGGVSGFCQPYGITEGYQSCGGHLAYRQHQSLCAGASIPKGPVHTPEDPDMKYRVFYYISVPLYGCETRSLAAGGEHK